MSELTVPMYFYRRNQYIFPKLTTPTVFRRNGSKSLALGGPRGVHRFIALGL